jgi:hypothetical protein
VYIGVVLVENLGTTNGESTSSLILNLEPIITLLVDAKVTRDGDSVVPDTAVLFTASAWHASKELAPTVQNDGTKYFGDTLRSVCLSLYALLQSTRAIGSRVKADSVNGTAELRLGLTSLNASKVSGLGDIGIALEHGSETLDSSIVRPLFTIFDRYCNVTSIANQRKSH